jgi:RNA polymerase sigma-70 factor (ECF subfamily)
MADVRSLAETVFRAESGRIIARLIRISGSFDRAEEAMQEAFAAALASWSEHGVPANPGAWITTAAHRRLIDAGRRERTRREKQESLRYEMGTAAAAAPEPEEEPMSLADDRLRLIFTCCHPALNREAQVALTLRTLGGLTTPEIARAFLVPEATLAQRLVRAKKKIQEARIPYEVPPADRLQERLAAVQAVIYLIFNEGYSASSGDRLVREDLCTEAVRLGRVLCDLMAGDAENRGLLALMLLQNSRRAARVSGGILVTLEEQDRSLWDRGAIAEGLALLDRALLLRRPGPYQVQAAIAALHARAGTAEETDWAQIAALYEKLLEWNPSPVVALNHAAAVAMSAGPEGGLRRMAALAGALEGYYLFHAARADLLRRLGRRGEAAEAYQRALELASNPVEREFLSRRVREMG